MIIHLFTIYVLVIKKYEFTYNEMRSSITSLSKNYIPITLILGMIDDSLIFCKVAYYNLCEYIKSIQRLTLKTQIFIAIRYLDTRLLRLHTFFKKLPDFFT